MEKQRSTTKERMQEVLAVLGVSAYEFENKCGLAHGFVARVTREITKKTRARIKNAYPTLNISYISLGQGEIFVKEQEAPETMRDRIRQFFEYMNLSKKDFVQKTGIAESFVGSMSENIRASSLEKIYRAFPLLNPEWLEYGEGNMLLDAPRKKSSDSVEDRIKKLIEFLGITTMAFSTETKIVTNKKNVTKRTIDKIVKRYPFVNPLWLMHGTGKMIEQQPKAVRAKVLYAPLVSQRAYAGYLTGLTDDEYIDSLDKIPYIEDEETRGNVIAIEVSGDSMDDGSAEGYRDGDIVLAKEIFMDRFCDLPIRRYDFVIVHRSGILIKRIIRQTKTGITIHSLNPDYGDVEINGEDILKLFIVTMRMSKQKR